MKCALTIFAAVFLAYAGDNFSGRSWAYVGKYKGTGDTLSIDLNKTIQGFYSKGIQDVSATLRFWNPASMDFGREIDPGNMRYMRDGTLLVWGVGKFQGNEFLLTVRGDVGAFATRE